MIPTTCCTLRSTTEAVVALVPRNSAALAQNASPPNGSAHADHRAKRRPHARGTTSVRRGGQFRKVLPNGEPNPARLAHGLQRVTVKSDAVVSSTSHSKSGFQGAPPPLRARDKIRDLFFERRKSIIFSPQALLSCRVPSPSRTSCLTAWHRKHEDRVEKFMNQPIVNDSQWHGIKPPFANYFWNLCLNAMFEGQRSVSTPPHADSKNQVLVCLMLVYVLKSGVRFNDTQRIWLWLWEADAAIQLPAWTLAAYPSALFYHFNLDAHDVKFVTTEGDERPTRENSRPIEPGDGDD
ncbi:hypothetical protein B0H13DRAFT_1888293 [Mycena leptocephala]|nr:hypothetical protein B0H13DRAFT_1888293 [Mycena leptocephala]